MSDNICVATIDQFLNNLRTDFEIKPLMDRCTVVTPYYYPDFAAIEISIEPIGNRFLLSDNGETLNMLFVNGLALDKNKNLYSEARRIAEAHQVELNNLVISVVADLDQLGEASNNLLAAIQAVGYLLYKRRNVEFSSFDDEVEKMLITHDTKYDYKYSIKGKAAHHTVKFHLNSGKNLLVEPITAGSVGRARSKSRLVAFMWLDIRQTNKSMKFVTVLDDRGENWEKFWADSEISSPIYTYSDAVIRWEEEKEKLLDLISE